MLFCITHLPQIAAMGDSHYVIEKGTEGSKTRTDIRLLDESESIEELARLLGGETITEAVRYNAVEMKETAKQSKKRNLFVERKDGEMQLRRGYTLKKGERVVIIEDVITTARTIKETMAAIKDFEPEVVAVGCIVDRTKGQTDYNIKSLLQIDPVVYEPDNCPLCKEGIPLVKPGSREEKKVNA